MSRAGVVLGAVVIALVVPLVSVAGAQVPIKGADEGVWGQGSHDCGPLFPVFVETAGIATHVGRYTYSSRECVDFATESYAGEFQLEAANGDRIEGTYTGTFAIVGAAIEYEQENTVEGGTGRFAGSSGGFHASGIASLVDCSAAGCHAQQTLRGTIASVGSSK